MYFKKSKAAFLPVLILLLLGILFGCSKPAKIAASSHASLSSKVSSSQVSKASSAPQVSSSQAVSSKPVQTPKRTSSASKTTSKQQTVQKSSPAPQYSKYITLTIDASKGGGGVVANSSQVGINPGDSVYTALKRYCDSDKIMVAGTSNYVSSIDGVAEFENGSQSGWIYSVNGNFAQTGCNSYKLSGGENVKWIYTIDDGKTEEGR